MENILCSLNSQEVRERVDKLLLEYIGSDTLQRYRGKVEKYFWKAFQSILAEDFGHKNLKKLYRMGKVFVSLALPEDLFFRIFKEVKELLKDCPEPTLEKRISMGFIAIMRAYLDVDDLPPSKVKTFDSEILSLLLRLKRHCKETRKNLISFILKGGTEEINKRLENAQAIMNSLKLHITDRKKFSKLENAFNLYSTKVISFTNDKKHDLDSLYMQIKDLDRTSRSFTELIDNMLLDMLYSTAFIDTLTGLYTRNYLEHALKAEVERAKRIHMPLSIIFIDVDNFKSTNDRYGHDAGDKVLMEVGKLFRRILRSCDIPIRLGGEEFLVLLPHTYLEGAIMVAERLRKTVEDTIIRYENSLIKTTISLGVSEVKDLENPYRYIKLADKALYTAKKQGKNRVVALNEA